MSRKPAAVLGILEPLGLKHTKHFLWVLWGEGALAPQSCRCCSGCYRLVLSWDLANKSYCKGPLYPPQLYSSAHLCGRWIELTVVIHWTSGLVCCSNFIGHGLHSIKWQSFFTESLFMIISGSIEKIIEKCFDNRVRVFFSCFLWRMWHGLHLVIYLVSILLLFHIEKNSVAHILAYMNALMLSLILINCIWTT